MTVSPGHTLATRGAALFGLLVMAGCGSDSASNTAHAASREPSDQGGDNSVVFRRVWKGTAVNYYDGKPSPDGRLLSLTDTSGNLAVLDLRTGERRAVTDEASVQPESFAESSTFSPDGRRLAYTWWSAGHGGYEVRIIDLDGSNPRVLLPYSDSIPFVQMEDWSADGSQLLTWGRTTEWTFRLMLVSVTDGATRFVGAPASPPQMAALSPDGRFVAYDEANDSAGTSHDIHAVEASGGQPRVLVGDRSYDDRLLGWLPDGSSVLFYSDRGAARGIWKQPVSDGRPTGNPQLVRGDVWNVVPLGFSHETYFYYVILETGPRLGMGSVDLEVGRLLTEPVAIEDPFEIRTRHGVWSPDGYRLAYLWQQLDDTWWSWHRLAVRDLRSGATSRIAFPFAQTDRIEWLSDNRSLAVYGETEQHAGIYRFDLVSGEVTPMLFQGTMQWGDVLHSALSPDGAILYHRSPAEPPDDESWKIVARELETARESEGEVARTSGMPQRMALAPDGGTLAYLEEDPVAGGYGVWIVATSGGPARQLYSRPFLPEEPTEVPPILWWVPDGSGVLMGGPYDTVGEVVMLLIPLDGGTPRIIRDITSVGHFRLNPDGSRFTSLFRNAVGEIWVIENLSQGGRQSRPDRY